MIGAIRLSHIGRNYPCLVDPNKPGFVTKFNSSQADVDQETAMVNFNQLANWGKMLLNININMKKKKNEEKIS